MVKHVPQDWQIVMHDKTCMIAILAEKLICSPVLYLGLLWLRHLLKHLGALLSYIK